MIENLDKLLKVITEKYLDDEDSTGISLYLVEFLNGFKISEKFVIHIQPEYGPKDLHNLIIQESDEYIHNGPDVVAYYDEVVTPENIKSVILKSIKALKDDLEIEYDLYVSRVNVFYNID